MTEIDILTAWALRFDGYLYCESARWLDADRMRATNNIVESLHLPFDPLKQLTVFFMLQRWLLKWGGETVCPRAPDWRAFRTLFLLTAGYEIPPRWRHGTWYAEWELDYQPHLADCIAIVAKSHSLEYDQPIMDPDLQLYHAEQYLFDVVGPRFQSNGFIDAFDFFSIIIWKANRAKSRIANRLLAQRSGTTLDTIVEELTRSLHHVKDEPQQMMRVLITDYGFRLPMASAILTVLLPKTFTVYDVRACEQISDPEVFRKLGEREKFAEIWDGYVRFIEAVQAAVHSDLSLRDKDRVLWARSAANQLRHDISNGFSNKKNV